MPGKPWWDLPTYFSVFFNVIFNLVFTYRKVLYKIYLIIDTWIPFNDYADTVSAYCRRPRGHNKNYADTTKTPQTLLESFWRLLTDFNGTIREKRYFCVFTKSSSIIKYSIWKRPYLKKNSCVRVFIDFAITTPFLPVQVESF